MYGLPEGFDASRFVGCTLEQVSFSANTVHLSFDNDISITIEASFTHSMPGDTDRSERSSLPILESRLMQLVGQSIQAAQASSDGTLTLTFGNGQALVCYDDTPQYEAYCLKLGDDEIIV
jgi:hypothetical protein